MRLVCRRAHSLGYGQRLKMIVHAPRKARRLRRLRSTFPFDAFPLPAEVTHVIMQRVSGTCGLQNCSHIHAAACPAASEHQTALGSEDLEGTEGAQTALALRGPR